MYVSNNFPLAIQIVIGVCFKKEMNKIYKGQTTVSNKSYINCYNTICRGFLIDDGPISLKCDFCEARFCIKCRGKHPTISKEIHVCKKEDIDSVLLLEQFVKCPKCKVSVEKINGCNFMTCGMCSTNFNYVTGKLSDYGTHNRTPVVLTDSGLYGVLKTTVFVDSIKILLDKINIMRPTVKSMDPIYRAITKGSEIGKLCLMFDQYLLSVKANSDYISCVNEIIQLEENGKLNENHISNIISICNKIIKK